MKHSSLLPEYGFIQLRLQLNLAHISLPPSTFKNKNNKKRRRNNYTGKKTLSPLQVTRKDLYSPLVFQNHRPQV